MEYKVFINEFEGPLDLLLHLIKQSKVEIWDVSISEITEQYLNYINTMENLHLDIASEYLEMAAELIQLKSRLLLPKPVEIEDDYEEDPREALINRLVEYRKYKVVTDEFRDLNEGRQLFFTKPPEKLSEYKEDTAIELPEDIEVYDLLSAFQKMMKRKALQKPIHTRITKREFTVEERVSEIKNILEFKDDKKVMFSDLFDFIDKDYLVVTFLSILELARSFYIELEQDGNCEEIYLVKKEGVTNE